MKIIKNIFFKVHYIGNICHAIFMDIVSTNNMVLLNNYTLHGN